MFGFFSSRKSLIDSGLLKGAVDNHSHILWGLDDGVSSQEETLSILSWLESLQVRALWLTPHTMEDVPNTTEGLKKRFQELLDIYKGPIELHLASEYMMDRLFEEHLENGDFLTHGDNKVLVETSIWGAPIDFWDLLDKMISKGFSPMIAHPERYRYMHMPDYERLRQMGCALQMNLPSIVGVYGETVRQKAEILLSKGWYDMLGSDCHRFRSIQGQYQSKVLTKEVLSGLSALMDK